MTPLEVGIELPSMVGVESHSQHQLNIGSKRGNIELQEHLRISSEMAVITS